ncbi:MAG: hypothetical protein A2015_04495 [Spirochaetes bacterium GWF1_31_7]|nr:MAG: hypothetical protein A2Y30_16775 [Spirochaetes bacterium GWE1_32_154]OHD51587.1 MAG: hypothetical protein A2Y29_07520 [Spirochaetes bacterium GWE2_31_10]OHD52979.1 MAG: hypothetical protein A2015_04495 [Spirochaetes bacterium GWF1_31_7]OHD82211.1 MAG: hypothetical protein A2355_12455 [Spirochaetes bacterium RIFOXYB1_FULL_32_8]HBD93724.1 hypothetical protein [Spirochaetia bacterium]
MNISELYFLLIPLIITGFGIFCCFWGYGVFRFTLVLLGFFTGIYLVITYGANFINDKNVLIIVAIAIGIILGILIIIFYYAGIFMSGALATLFILNFAGLRLHITENILILIGICLAGGILSLIFQRLMIVVTTAIIGSFCMINGVGFLIYNLKFGNSSFIKYFNALEKSNDLYYLILFIVAILAICGIIFQLKMIPEEKTK